LGRNAGLIKIMDIKEQDFQIAYFSMEIALEGGIKTYSGGLGVLAGDILRSAADLELPMIGVTLLSRNGYFHQKINKQGEQEEYPAKNYNFSKLKKIKQTINIRIGKDKVKVGAWQYDIKSPKGFKAPVYLLDTDFISNKKTYRRLTDNLYGGDKDYRLLQETILGRGGYALVKKLGYKINKFHINEGHGSFVAIAKFLDLKNMTEKEKIKKTKEACVFTTHTPVKMAHDIFSLEKVLAYQFDFPYKLLNLIENKQVNMTKIGLYFSSYINGVALSHKELSMRMFPSYPIYCVTNGVHSQTWTATEFKKLYDKYIPNWRNSSLSLRNAFSLPLEDIWQAHQKTKKRLISLVNKATEQNFKENVFTIGFARRFTAYKRPILLLENMERLLEVQKNTGKIQIVYGGKAHPLDEQGKKLIAEVNRISQRYKDKIKIAFIENYDMDLAKIIISGVDLWLNTPLPPNEASGTSGMKAAHNGVPQLSSFDGWWREGYIKGKTGWTIQKDSDNLYFLLEQEIIPLYYQNPKAWQEIMRFVIGINASFFNTERVLREYIQNAYI
jgi:glycogen phosphorylase